MNYLNIFLKNIFILKPNPYQGYDCPKYISEIVTNIIDYATVQDKLLTLSLIMSKTYVNCKCILSWVGRKISQSNYMIDGKCINCKQKCLSQTNSCLFCKCSF